jgi:hypothetical protein
MDQEHARAIAEIMYGQTGVYPTVATSEDPTASRKIADFAVGRSPWIVAVRMISEGVDIPRLRVGVYATNTVTELFFRQAVGRLVRWTGGPGRQAAYMLIPDDKRLRTFSAGIAEQRRHCLRKPAFDEDDDFGRHGSGDAEAPRERADEESPEDRQLSLFAAISAVALDENGRPIDNPRVVEEESGEAGEAPIPDLVDMSQIEVNGFRVPLPERVPLRPVPLPHPEPSHTPATTSALARRRQLREQNSAAVVDIVHATGKGHAQVNAALNKKVGIKRITEASIRQLERRLVAAQALLHAPGRGRVFA